MHDTTPIAEQPQEALEQQTAPSTTTPEEPVDLRRRLEAHEGLSLLTDEALEAELRLRRRQQDRELVEHVQVLTERIDLLVDKWTRILAALPEDSSST